MTRNPSPAEIGGMDPRQDAPEISGNPSRDGSQDLTPAPRATGHPEGGSSEICAVEALYDPLHDCPPKYRDRYRRAAEQAGEGRYPTAVKLKCLDCSGWEYLEAKRCEIQTCALWLLNRRVFGASKADTKSPRPTGRSAA